MMIVHPAKPLFAWDELVNGPSPHTIRELLAALPDAKLLNSLRAARGKGRDDHPVHVLWGVLVLRVALRHPSAEAVLAELRRNEALRRLVGIVPERRVPKSWDVSRFEDALGREPHRALLKEVFRELVRRLGAVGDATALSARRKPEAAARTTRTTTAARPRSSSGSTSRSTC